MFKKFVEEQIRTALEERFNQIPTSINQIHFEKESSTDWEIFFTVDTIWEGKVIFGSINTWNGVDIFNDNSDMELFSTAGYAYIN